MNSLRFVQLPAFKRPSDRKILWRRHFSQLAEKKGGEGGKGGVGSKIIVTIHTGFATFTAFTSGILIKCQFLACHISVDGVTKSATSIEPHVSRHPQHRRP
jgi:hypothetical protein